MNRTIVGFLLFFGIIGFLVYVSNQVISKELEQSSKPVISQNPQNSQPSQPVEDKVISHMPVVETMVNTPEQPDPPEEDKAVTSPKIIYELPLEDTILVQ